MFDFEVFMFDYQTEQANLLFDAQQKIISFSVCQNVAVLSLENRDMLLINSRKNGSDLNVTKIRPNKSSQWISKFVKIFSCNGTTNLLVGVIPIVFFVFVSFSGIGLVFAFKVFGFC